MLHCSNKQSVFLSVLFFINLVVLSTSSFADEKETEVNKKPSTNLSAKDDENLKGLDDQSKKLFSENELIVMSYNIQQLGYPNWFANHFELERLNLIPKTIFAMEPRPDVLVFQEVFTDIAAQKLTHELSSLYPYATGVAAASCSKEIWDSVSENCDEGSIKGNSGVMIFSQWPLLEKHSHIYDSVRVSYTFDFLARKGAVYGKLKKGEKIYHVVGTHLQADGGSHDIRMAQINEMRAWLDAFNIPNSEPVIMGGDFNVSSLKTMEFANLLSVANAWVDLEEGLPSVSASTNEYLKMIYNSGAEKTLDFVLYRADHLQPVNKPKQKTLNFKSSEPWQGQGRLGKEASMRDLSDHYPVISHFEY